MALDSDKVNGFIGDMKAAGLDAWVIGRVVEGNNTAEINKKF